MSDGEGGSERWARRLAPLVLATTVLAAYANTFQAPLVFDGLMFLREDSPIRSLTAWPGILRVAPSRPAGHYSFAISYAVGEHLGLGGYHLPTWHLSNLLIHLAAACTAFGILRRTFVSPRLVELYGAAANRLALTIAALWAVHPLNTQSVTYLYQRVESQMGLFYLLTLYTFIRFCESGRWRWGVTSLVSCVLGTTTKEVALTAPLMVLWYDRAFVAGSWRELRQKRDVFHLLLWGMLLVPSVFMYFTGDRYQGAGIGDVARVSPQAYAVTQLEVVEHYLRLSVWPSPLNLDYQLPPAAVWPAASWLPTSIDWSRVAAPGVVIALLLLLTVVSIWKWPAVGFLGGWWFVILAPTSSFLPIIDLVFEHRTYLSLLAPITLLVLAGDAALGWCVARLGVKPVAITWSRGVTAVATVIALAVVTHRRNEDYRDAITLWGDVVAKAPANVRAHYSYGVALLEQKTPATRAQAVGQFEAALAISPLYFAAHVKLGEIALADRRLDDAESHFREALKYSPDDPAALRGEAAVQAARKSDPPSP